MGKQSRRQRKLLRGKRERAESHGLPIGPDAQPRVLPIVGPATSADAVQGSTPPVGVLPMRGGWSNWPLSVKLLLAGIVVLVVIGLFRRYAEDRAKASHETSAPAQPSLNASASLLAAPAGTPN
jgi:hypothetical protein